MDVDHFTITFFRLKYIHQKIEQSNAKEIIFLFLQDRPNEEDHLEVDSVGALCVNWVLFQKMR